MISTGDDSNPFESQGYTPIDERPGREAFDAQRSPANTNDLRGKILRITPRPDGTYSIPSSNLFAPGMAKTRPEIFAMGLRNPFRIDVDQKTGTLVAADYGPDANQPNADRGPEGRVTWHIVEPGNYGWPYCHGGAAYRDWTFPSGPAASRPRTAGVSRFTPAGAAAPAPSWPGPKRDTVTFIASSSQRISTRRVGVSPTTSPSPVGTILIGRS